MFKEVADIKTSDQLHLPVPEAKFETVVVQPSEHQQAMVAELSERAAAVHSGVVDPSVDNMLKITSDGRKLGLDQRLMNPLLPDDPNSKLNACVRNVLRIYEEGQSDKLTQLLFCDLSTPKNDGTFNVYEDIRAKLIQSGVPEEEIAFIHDADTEAKNERFVCQSPYRTGSGVVRFDTEDGRRHERAGQAGGRASSGCGLAACGHDPAKWSYHPSGKPKQRGAGLSVCDGRNL